MATQQQVELLRRALGNLSTLARQSLLSAWSPAASFPEQRAVLDELWPDLVATYAEAGVAVAADLLDSWLPGVEPVLVRPVDEGRALGRMRWAIGTGKPAGSLSVVLDELVKQPARSTIARTSEAAGVGWARVPAGAETCAFCRMLAGRGAVYTSAGAAGEGRKFHGACDCMIITVRGETDYPAGHDPSNFQDAYLEARSRAGTASTKQVLSAMRRIEHSH